MDWPRSGSSRAGRTSPSLLSVGSVIAAMTLLTIVIAWAVLLQREPPGTPAVVGTPPTPSREVSAPGVTVRATISASGALSTRTRVEFGHASSSLAFSVPMTVPGIGTSARPVIDHLRLIAAGEPVVGVPSRLRAGSSTTVGLPRGTKTVELAYHARGVTAESHPATPGRALVLATPLSLATPSALPTTIKLEGGNILNLGCWTPDGPPAVCGKRHGGTWKVYTPAGSGEVAVLAQINIASPTRE
jgi:hypothetical protein